MGCMLLSACAKDDGSETIDCDQVNRAGSSLNSDCPPELPIQPNIQYGDLFFEGEVDREWISIREHNELRQSTSQENESHPDLCLVHTSSHFLDINNHQLDYDITIELRNIFVGDLFCRNFDIYRFFPNLIRPGLREYSLRGLQTERPSVRIQFKDLDGNSWHSDIGKQNGKQSFIIERSEPVIGSNHPIQLTQRVGGTFSCEMFDLHGNQMSIRNARFLYDFTYYQ